MPDPLDKSAPFNDDQGTRISGNSTGSGAEATEATNGEPKSNGQDPRSDYGGQEGEPKESSDIPTSRR